ncbi:MULTISPECIES: peptide-methionine (S)-S-oxide reductase MsrA [unclassified Sphingobacterium]|uniref:peptide-methionine (S)-S-oxide reductase MsrA n=1 Tax=unclassified Sphingobacterium TaxID=2609468 RepID=UPI0025D6DDA9|nr:MULTISPECIES: peptide-methionine (S)-S-oxide reductase MsrA [unclassified Sphingobacterium]
MKYVIIVFAAIFLLSSCQTQTPTAEKSDFSKLPEKSGNTLDTATFAAGCFWCTEAQFKELKGVQKVVSGYTGGWVVNPSYAQVCTGNTGHAEATVIVYDPKVISYDNLLEAFFVSHDPTQFNRQGDDVGIQYRSAIFVHNKEQLGKVRFYIAALNKEKVYREPVVTEVVPATAFYPAEDYHQDYYKVNGKERYCQLVIKPKLEKFKRIFSKVLKEGE